MRVIAAILMTSAIAGCSTATPLSLTPQKEIVLNRDFNSAADCFYQRMAAQRGSSISKAELPSQRASEVKMQMDAIGRWSVLFSDAGKSVTKVTISTMETIWSASAQSAANDLLPEVQACGA